MAHLELLGVWEGNSVDPEQRLPGLVAPPVGGRHLQHLHRFQRGGVGHVGTLAEVHHGPAPAARRARHSAAHPTPGTRLQAADWSAGATGVGGTGLGTDPPQGCAVVQRHTNGLEASQ